MAAVGIEIVALFDFVHARLRERLKGLTDEEYLWEPVPGCWTVRPDGLDGGGATPRFTTIAWRVCHVSDAIARHPMNGFLEIGWTPPAQRSPVEAESGVRYLEDSFATWRALIISVEEGRWLEPLGPAAGPFSDSALFGVGLHTADEFIHHGAEIALLRDLYEANSAGAARFPTS